MRLKIRNALVSLILLLLATGCAKTQTVYRTETVYRYPPTILTQPCPVPAYEGETWGDITKHTARLQLALNLCNVDKRLLREWASSNE